MLEVRDERGKVLFYHINAEHDGITCPSCRVAVPQGMVCSCHMKTKGPQVENTTRQILTGSQSGKS